MAFTIHRRALTVALATGGLLAGIVALAAQPSFVDLRRQQPIHGDAAAGAAKAAACAACHGANGIATAPTFPNLAGQSETYLYVQLHTFKSGARDNAIMNSMVATLSDQDMRDLAAFYASLPGKHTSGTAQSSSRGYILFHDGDPAQGIPPCQGCHGVEGLGPQPDPTSTAPQPAWSTFPALASQNAPYVLEQLKAFQSGTRNGTSNARIMHGVTHNLDEADMQAVADYVSTL